MRAVIRRTQVVAIGGCGLPGVDENAKPTTEAQSTEENNLQIEN
jgi:hypothetical protein